MVKRAIFHVERDAMHGVLAAERTAALRRAAATALQLVEGNEGACLIGIAAPIGGEGSSMVAETLADTMGAHHGGRVILIDGVRSEGDVGANPDLHAVSNGGVEVVSLLRREPNEGFHRVQGFHPGAFPGRREAEAFTNALRSACDVVVFVLPPLLKHPEALSLAARLDGIILVLEAERSRWEVAREAKHLMDGIGVKFLGVILNKRKRHIPDFLYRLL